MTTRGHKGPRLFVDDLRALLIDSQQTSLSSSDSHYVRDVLRIAKGETIELADPKDGFTCITEVVALLPHVTVKINMMREPETNEKHHLVLLMALCKGQKNELICDWATELGCTHIAFWQATRSIVRLKNESDADAKAAKFTKVALAAAQQSRQLQPPRITVATSLTKAIERLPLQEGVTPVCCSLGENLPTLATVTTTAKTLPNIRGWIVAIGPEGDLTVEEEQSLAAAGFMRVSLGNTILRSELAAVAAILPLRSAQ